MKNRLLVVCLLLFALLLPQTAFGWNYTGHEVVARIAWEKMRPETRRRAMALLMQAPADSDLLAMLPRDRRPLSIRQREWFMLAATWADVVRSEDFPERRQKYHRSIWHFTNFFWRQENGVAVDVPELRPEPTNIVERLGFLQREVVDERVVIGQRATDLAWILHLVGDIHQPLHTSARVTEQEPKGDQGGNLFELTPQGTPREEIRRLHGYWDDILNKSHPRRKNESDIAYAERIAKTIMRRQPERRLRSRLRRDEYAAWAQEGLASAKTKLYPPWLKRFEMPSEQYRREAYAIAEPAVALAGYRLAATLDRIFAR